MDPSLQIGGWTCLEDVMKQKFLILTCLTLLGSVSFAKNNEVMGLIARCECTETTIDGERSLGKFPSEKSFRTEKAARNSVYHQCLKEASDSLSVSVRDCQYIKIVDQKVGKAIKRRVENIKDDEENNLHNDLISTL